MSEVGVLVAGGTAVAVFVAFGTAVGTIVAVGTIGGALIAVGAMVGALTTVGIVVVVGEAHAASSKHTNATKKVLMLFIATSLPRKQKPTFRLAFAKFEQGRSRNFCHVPSSFRGREKAIITRQSIKQIIAPLVCFVKRRSMNYFIVGC